MEHGAGNLLLQLGENENIPLNIELAGGVELPEGALFDDDEATLYQPLAQAGMGNRFEEVISTIPAGDLVLGCLIKAGIATPGGQLARCYFQTPAVPYWRRRVREILN